MPPIALGIIGSVMIVRLRSTSVRSSVAKADGKEDPRSRVRQKDPRWSCSPIRWSSSLVFHRKQPFGEDNKQFVIDTKIKIGFSRSLLFFYHWREAGAPPISQKYYGNSTDAVRV
jgi:hypothetical protein